MIPVSGHFILVNMDGDPALMVVGDLLTQWGYVWSHLSRSDPPFDLPDGTISMVFFQFRTFSEGELELFRALRRSLPEAPFLVTSPFISIKHILQIAPMGIAEYLGQPFTPQELRAVLEKIAPHLRTASAPMHQTT